MGRTVDSGVTFNRPADTTAYAIGDLIADSTTAGSVTPMSFGFGRGALIWRIRIRCNITAWKGGIIRLHLFRSRPTVAVGDNGAFNSSETYQVTESLYLGYADVTLSQQFSDGWVKGFASASSLVASFQAENVWGLLEARTAVTPTSGAQFVTTLEMDVD